MQRSSLKDVLHKTLREEFTNIQILDVQFDEDVGEDGDPILNVRVIFSGDRRKVDVGRIVSFLRHVRSNMEQDGVESGAFPVMSFISKSEWKGPIAEAG